MRRIEIKISTYSAIFLQGSEVLINNEKAIFGTGKRSTIECQRSFFTNESLLKKCDRVQKTAN